MANDENQLEETIRGNEWEVVSLTESTYAAEPGPMQIQSAGDDKLLDGSEESSQALFNSQFVLFAPIDNENIPLEPEISKICSESVVEREDLPKKCEADPEKCHGPDEPGYVNQKVEEISLVDGKNVFEFFDEKGKSLLPLANMNFKDEMGEEKELQGLDLVAVHSLCSPGKLSSHAKVDVSRSTPFDEISASTNYLDPSLMNIEPPSGLSSPGKVKEHNHVLCGVWWRRHARSLYSHAKEANKFWSVVIAAALMGLAILGQRWQQERWQPEPLKLQFNIKDENIKGLSTPLSRLKVALVNGKGHSVDHGSTRPGY